MRPKENVCSDDHSNGKNKNGRRWPIGHSGTKAFEWSNGEAYYVLIKKPKLWVVPS